MKDLVEIVAILSRKLALKEEDIRDHPRFRELTSTQLHYLETISLMKNPSLSELAEAMRTTKPTVTVAIEKLIEKDFVYKVKSDTDRRSAHLHLTEKGDLINRLHDQVHQEIAGRIAEKMTPKEKEQLSRLLGKIADDLE